MAKYINRKSQSIHIHVTRVDKGVYMFGSKQINVKLEEGLISVRVGGGYTSIDDFIDIYAPTELQKSAENRETSPQQRSPKAKAKIPKNPVSQFIPGSSPKAAAKTFQGSFSMTVQPS